MYARAPGRPSEQIRAPLQISSLGLTVIIIRLAGPCSQVVFDYAVIESNGASSQFGRSAVRIPP